MQQRVKEQIKDSLLRAIGVCTGNAFYKSQMICPVISGYLRSTGNLNPIPDGIELKYSAEYASFPERGILPGMIHVPTYRKKNGHIVRAYSYFSRGQRAQHYIQGPMEESFKESGRFAREFENQLKLQISGKGKVIRI